MISLSVLPSSAHKAASSVLLEGVIVVAKMTSSITKKFSLSDLEYRFGSAVRPSLRERERDSSVLLSTAPSDSKHRRGVIIPKGKRLSIFIFIFKFKFEFEFRLMLLLDVPIAFGLSTIERSFRRNA